MSGQVVSIVARRKLGSATRKAVMLVLADCASDNGAGIYTSQANIAERTEVSDRTVRRIISDFISEGLLLERGWRTFDSGAKVKEYDLDMEALSALPSTRTAAEKAPGQNVHVDTGARLTGHSRHKNGRQCPTNRPEPSLTVNTHTARASRLKPDLPSEEFVEAIRTTWNAMAEAVGLNPILNFTPERLRNISWRLADCGGDETALLQAIANIPNNPHWIGKTQGGWRADFDWVFRQRDRFITALETVTPPPEPKARHDKPAQHRRSADLDRAAHIAMQQMAVDRFG